MNDQHHSMTQAKKIALVAHDNKKRELLDWAQWNRTLLAGHRLYATFIVTSPLLSRPTQVHSASGDGSI